VTEHVELARPAGANVHVLGAVKVPVPALNVPAPELEKVTFPLGADLAPALVSLTVALQLVF
jgi:hypothetical protein